MARKRDFREIIYAKERILIMPAIYTMSDIHGCYNELMESLNFIDLESNDLLVFLGDYVDGGDESFQVLNKIMNLEKAYPDQVIVLLGNHDEWFCNWLFYKEDAMDSYIADVGFKTASSFFDESELQEMIRKVQNFTTSKDRVRGLDDLLHKKIMESESFEELLNWLKKKTTEKRYYETDGQIFVHAGIDEEAEEYWKLGTMDYIFTGKFPATTGPFYKDIVSGHINSEVVAKNEDYLGTVYWDEYSHFFIDGNTPKSKIVPVLKYDTRTSNYSSFKYLGNSWEEYVIK